MQELEKARLLVDLDNQIQAAIKTINAAALRLNVLNMEVKLTGWDWSRPGEQANITSRGGTRATIVDTETRPTPR